MNSNKSPNVIPFHYVVVTAAILATASVEVQLVLQADSEFELHYIMGTGSLDLVGDFQSNSFSVLITDQSTGRQLMNARVPQRLLCGPANRSLWQRRPVIFMPQAVLNFDILNLSGANPNTVTIALIGYKHFLTA